MRSAIAQVNSDASGADTIAFVSTLVNPTIKLANCVLTILKSTTVTNANFFSDKVTIDAQSLSRIFVINSGTTVTIQQGRLKVDVGLNDVRR